jgi:anaerobic selenocysteine-containing dehydrogenase
MKHIVGACPLDCPDGCSWIVTVDDDGRAVKLRGNPDHPFTRGGLCKKVNPWLEHAADPGRLMFPQRRTGPKGSGQFEPISWDEAIAEIASRFQNSIDRHGGASIWPYVGTGNMGFIQGANGPQRLWNRLGASAHESTICSVSGHVGIGYTAGTAAGMDPERVVDAGVVMIWGSNTLVANQHFWPFVKQAKDRGAPVIVVDPVTTATARRADTHLAPLPGTDAALALGLMRVLLDANAIDHDFIERRTHGAAEFIASLDEWTPRHTANITGVAASQISHVGEMLAGHRPLALKLGQGMQRHRGGGQAARVISCLPALLGSYDEPGGGLVYSTSDGYRFNFDALHRPNLGSRPRSLAMTRLASTLNQVNDPPITSLVIQAANPLVSNPDTDAIRRALVRDDLFTVVIDVFPTETSRYADLVLPSTLQHEHLEVNDSFSHFYVDLNLPAVDPPGECLSHTEIWRRVAAAMGLTDPALFATDAELVDDLLSAAAFAQAGITRASLTATGFARLPGTDDWSPFAKRFWTPSGRFEFVSEQAELDGHGALPHSVAPAETGRADATSYSLIAAASEFHVNSMFASTMVTRAKTTGPRVVVHPDDAKRDGFGPGDRVRVHNSRGSFDADLAVSPSTRPGVAATTKGSWSLNVNATVDERDSDMGRGAVFHDNKVAITKLPSPAQ